MAKFTRWGRNIAAELFPTYSSQTQREKPEKNEILVIRTWQLPVIICWHVQPELRGSTGGMNIIIFFLRQIIYFSCMNHSVTTDHWTLINVIIQLSEALCFFLSRFHLQTVITGWVRSTFWETKQSRSIQNGKKCPGSSQEDRDHWDSVIWVWLKRFWVSIDSTFPGGITASSHSFIIDKYLLGAPRTRLSLRQHRERPRQRFPSPSGGGGLNTHADKLLALKMVKVDEQKLPLAWAKTLGLGHLDSHPRNFREKLCGPNQGM